MKQLSYAAHAVATGAYAFILTFALAFALIFASGCTPVYAQDHADIDKSQIIGNRELPKVLYIVPWKKPIPGDLSGKPLQSVIDEALAPIDKDVFEREVHYETPPAAATAAAAKDQANKKSVTTTNTNTNSTTKQP